MADMVILAEHKQQDYVCEHKTFILRELKKIGINLGASSILTTLWTIFFKS